MVIFTNYCLFLKFTVVVFFVFDYNRQENIFEAIQRYHCIRMEDKMEIVCLDLEGVLVPEIWIAFAEETGIPELKKTTRDEPDYDKLMKYRLNILKEHNLGLKEIQETIAKIDPLPGAKEFLDKLRELTQVIIISDTFSQFAGPLMKKLGYPTIFCNSLVVADNGEIIDFKMR